MYRRIIASSLSGGVHCTHWQKACTHWQKACTHPPSPYFQDFKKFSTTAYCHIPKPSTHTHTHIWKAVTGEPGDTMWELNL